MRVFFYLKKRKRLHVEMFSPCSQGNKLRQKKTARVSMKRPPGRQG